MLYELIALEKGDSEDFQISMAVKQFKFKTNALETMKYHKLSYTFIAKEKFPLFNPEE